MSEAICCGECSWPVPPGLWNRQEGVHCPGCRRRLGIAAFPAVAKTRAGASPQAIAADTEASCFYHTASRAVVPCEECGRFLCSLCDLEIDGKHLCPVCLKSGLAANRLENVETRRTLYDTMALALAIFPPLLIWPAIVGAPAALFIVIRRWNAPLSVLPRTRVRYYIAAALAVAELAGFVVLFWAIAHIRRPGSS